MVPIAEIILKELVDISIQKQLSKLLLIMFANLLKISVKILNKIVVINNTHKKIKLMMKLWKKHLNVKSNLICLI
jgi:hypothetical protein